MTTTLTSQTKHTATLTNQTRSGLLNAGSPIGLLLALTYANIVASVFTNQSRNLATITNQTKS